MSTTRRRVYGFDPGTKFGWAIRDDGALIDSGVWITWKKGHPGRRFRNARLCLHRLFVKYPPPPGSVIAFESVQAAGFRSKTNLRVYTGLLAQLVEVAGTFGIEVEDILEASPSSIKLHATGDGTASKQEMIRAVINEYGFEPATDDEADAIWCADHCQEDSCQKSTCTHEGKRRTPSTRRSKPKPRKPSTKAAKSSSRSTAKTKTTSKRKRKVTAGMKAPA